MTDIFEPILKLGAPFSMVVMIVLISCAAGAIKIVATEIRKFGCHRQDIDFKRELVDRGLSAEEIERILAAAGSGVGGTTNVHVGNYVDAGGKGKSC
jgi:hypothetical protein